MTRLTPIAADALREEPWANGLGTTTLIASGPDNPSDPAAWRWRLSIATLAQDGPFSSFPGTRRQLAVLDAPLRLRFDASDQRELLRLAVTHFDGAQAPYASLLEGPTRAFNLMLRENAQGELLARPLNGSMWLPVRADRRWFVHLLSGSAEVQVESERADLAMGGNLWVDAQPGERLRIEGGGELILVQLAN